jgi:hypothetical protein
LAPVKVASVVNKPVDLAISNTVPSSVRAALLGRPEEIALGVDG